MENRRPFIQIGTTLINIDSIAFIVQLQNGALRITTMATRKDGSSHSFIITAAEHVAELRRQIYPYVALALEDASIQGGTVD